MFPEDLANLVRPLAPAYSHIVLPGGTLGADLAPYLAALLGVGQLSEVVAVLDADTFECPMYGGSALATMRMTATVRVLTIRASAFQPAPDGPVPAPVSVLAGFPPVRGKRLLDRTLSQRSDADLLSARSIVAGGRGLRSKAEFDALLRPLAHRLGAGVGGSRSAVECGFLDADAQIGQTGKVVAPDLYLAVAVSGAIQHVAGVRGAKLIVAINKDPEAPIFEFADFGLVGDLFEVIPALEAELNRRQSHR